MISHAPRLKPGSYRKLTDSLTGGSRRVLPPRPLPSPPYYRYSRASSELISSPIHSLAPRLGLCVWARRSRVGMIYCPVNTSGVCGVVRRIRSTPPPRSAPARPFLVLAPSCTLRAVPRPSTTITSKSVTQAFHCREVHNTRATHG